MKKRDKRLRLSKETILNLMTPVEGQNLVEIAGGSCTVTGGSTAGGTRHVCCLPDP